MSKNAFHFKGLSVLAPTGFVPLEFSIPGNIPGKSNDFIVIRYITNIALYNDGDYKINKFDEPIKDFGEQPIEFRITYNKVDVGQARGIDNLKLAYWSIGNGRWEIVSDTAHDFQILPPSTGRVAEFKIWAWEGDPTLAWGR